MKEAISVWALRGKKFKRTGMLEEDLRSASREIELARQMGITPIIAGDFGDGKIEDFDDLLIKIEYPSELKSPEN